MAETLNTQGRVVVGTDLSHHADRAVEWAAARAHAHGLPLLIVLVLPEVPIPKRSRLYDAMLAGDYPADLHARGEERLVREQARVVEMYPNLQVETHLVMGSASYVLAGASGDAHLVVVGARGAGAPAKVRALGGTADAVTTHAHGPVAVIRQDTQPDHPGPVVVGVDDSPEALAAVTFAVDEAATRRVPLVAVYAWDTTPLLLSAAGLWSVDTGQMATSLGEMVHEIMAPYLADHPGLELDVRVIPERAASALIEASAEASMLVVGSRGRNAFVGLLLGSTSKEVLREAECPVVVVRK